MFSLLLWVSAIITVIYGDCDIISKKDWGGILPLKVDYLARPVELVIIEHTATSHCTTDEDCVDIVSSIQNKHMDEYGWSDIGLNFLVGGQGKVYEGAGWLHIGAHTFGYNSISIGIMFIGNFNKDRPTEEALKAVKDVLECGVKNGHLSENYQLIGHRQVSATESPGRYLYNEIRTWPNYVDDKNKIKKKKQQPE